MRILTIGFTQKSAEEFFELLMFARVKKVVDIRLHNTSQLAGFTKRDDLRYFLNAIGNIDYQHVPLLAPTAAILSDYKMKRIDWVQYETRFLSLMRERHIETKLDPIDLDNSCLLCSEVTPEKCHRRLVIEYLRNHWADIDVSDLI